MKNLFSFLVLAMVLGCSGSDSSSGASFSPDPPLVIGGDERPADVEIPSDYDPEVSYPLVMVLHGRGVDGQTQAGYFQLRSFVDEKQFVLTYPNGTLDEGGTRVWNATEACCAADDSVNDVEYLTGLIEEAQRTYNIDAKRVYLIGHSNGGFMSFRLACDSSEHITALVSLAGATYANPDDCQPATLPVSVLVVHGTDDETVFYEGGIFEETVTYPGAVENVERFAEAGGCNVDENADEGPVDVVATIEGAETDRIAYTSGCDEGIDAGLWTINDGGHIPIFSIDFADLTTDWLLRHSR